MPVDAYRKTLAQLHVAVTDIGEALRTLSIVLAQGPREDNAASRGAIATQLEAAAWRIRHGTLEGFHDDVPRSDGLPSAALLKQVAGATPT